MITTAVPETWRALEDEVGRVLGECGFEVEIGKTIETARGSVTVDVFAVERVAGREYTILCECKHWSASIPQTVVHAFRSVISDCGANAGYILCTSNFQSGARATAAYSNLSLVTWQEFLEQFEETWLARYFAPTITRELDLLMEYTEPLVPSWFLEVSAVDKEILRRLRDKYCQFGMTMMMFTTYVRVATSSCVPPLPIRKPLFGEDVGSGGIPSEILDAEGYREFLDACLVFGRRAIEEFEEVKRRVRGQDS